MAFCKKKDERAREKDGAQNVGPQKQVMPEGTIERDAGRYGLMARFPRLSVPLGNGGSCYMG